MAEYISREEAKKRAIAIPLGGKFVEVVPVGEIEALPAADVRPVVYCRECIHWKKSELVICGNNDMVCDYHIGARYCRHADDFCSKGERSAE